MLPLVSKKRMYTHILTHNFGCILTANDDYNDIFGRFGPILHR